MLRSVFKLLFVIVLIGGILALGSTSAHGATVITVNSIGDESDFLPGAGGCNTITGVCTLRAALQEAAYFSTSSFEIRFNIPGSAPFIISPASALPNIRNASILGPNQSGDLVILDGTSAGSTQGLYIVTATSPIVITGMQVQNFSMYGIGILNSNVTIGGDTPEASNVIIDNVLSGIQVMPSSKADIMIKGNLIGLNRDGFAHPNGNGIDVSQLSSDITIESNVISGNAGWGVAFTTCQNSGSAIYKNKIGMKSNGTTALQNGLGGILIQSSSDIHIGGADGQGNLIAGNYIYGIQLDRADTITIQANLMSTNSTATALVPNFSYDIQGERSDNITIGGDSEALGNVLLQGIWLHGTSDHTTSNNVIKFNKVGITGTGFKRTVKTGSVGVALSSATNNLIQLNTVTRFDTGVLVMETMGGNQISQNAIYDNGKLGIDLDNDGVTDNDDLDADTGPNGLQNFPVITTVELRNVAGERYLDLYGTFNSKASMNYLIEIFNGRSCDVSGYGEGEEYVTSVDITTDAFGNANWSKTDILSIPTTRFVGKCLTSTATEVSSKSTSEFSNGVFFGMRYFLPEIFK